MATQKLNSRSPYYIVASGNEGCDTDTQSISITGPDTGTTNSNITLNVVANNFTPVSYAWTGGAIAGNTSASVTFTETSDGSVTYGVTATDQCGNEFTASKTVSWSANVQYTATLTVVNNISGPSAGYTIGGDLNNAVKTGETGDAYSFTTTLSLNSGFTADVALAISPSQPINGTFASANVTETTTLTGTVSRIETYTLSRDQASIIEGDQFRITLTTTGVENNTSVPYTITGIDSNDLSSGNITGAFVVQGNTTSATDSITFTTAVDTVTEGTETATLTLNNITPTNSISVTIADQAPEGGGGGGGAGGGTTVNTILISNQGYLDTVTPCAVDAVRTVYYVGTIGNGTYLYSDQSLTIPAANDGNYYRIGDSPSYYGRIGQTNNGQISEYTVCPAPTPPTTPNDTSGSVSVSDTSVSNEGLLGANVCALSSFQTLYFDNSLTLGDGVFLYVDSSRQTLFGGSGNYYKFDNISTASGTDDYYGRILGDVANTGKISEFTQCGYAVEEEEPVGPPTEPTVYYARFITCGEPGGAVIPVSSSSQISTFISIKDNNECHEYLDNIQSAEAIDISNYLQYADCAECEASVPPTPPTPTPTPTPTLAYFRQYVDCETGLDILKEYGSTTDLASGSGWPVSIYDGVCMNDKGTAGTASSENIANFAHYQSCADCESGNAPAPTPTPTPTPTINKFNISSATQTTSTAACSNISTYDVKLAYSGTLADGTYLYMNEALTILYTPSSTDFVRTQNGYSFRIGVTNPGQVSNLTIC
jgi:hypothetical protein